MNIKSFLAAGILTGFAVLGSSAIASADMNINATGGSGTAVDSDGTQGSFKPAVQGTQDSDNEQDAVLRPSQEFVPQYKAGSK